MIISTRAIVINYLRYGDNSLIVDLYTESLGRQTVFVKGAFSKRSSIRSAFFQQLHLLETCLHHRVNRQMQRLSDVQMYYTFANIPYNPVKSGIVMFIAEVLYKTLREEEANAELFEFLAGSVQALDLNESGTENFHLVFLVHFSRYLGFYLKYDDLLQQFCGVSFEGLKELSLSHQQRNCLIESILDIYSANMANFGTMKSYNIVKNFND